MTEPTAGNTGDLLRLVVVFCNNWTGKKLFDSDSRSEMRMARHDTSAYRVAVAHPHLQLGNACVHVGTPLPKVWVHPSLFKKLLG